MVPLGSLGLANLHPGRIKNPATLRVAEVAKTFECPSYASDTEFLGEFRYLEGLLLAGLGLNNSAATKRLAACGNYVCLKRLAFNSLELVTVDAISINLSRGLSHRW